jgi:hypothetical protein
LTTPVFLATSAFGAYYFFAIMSLLGAVMCAFFMFETKGHSLEFIEQKYAEKQSSETDGRWWQLGGKDLKEPTVQVVQV